MSATTRPAMTEGHVVLAPAGGTQKMSRGSAEAPGPGEGTFGLGGAQQRVAGDDHVQDGLGQVGVQVSHGGGEHDDVLGERLIWVGQAPVHVADTVVGLQAQTGVVVQL